MDGRHHHRAFAVAAGWTLALLTLGSIVHATGSSLACPDWPTCFGTMTPEMKGGVFWEHLHRLVAGGLILLWLVAMWLTHRETRDRPWIFRASLWGLGLLLVQAVFGGLTVIFRLPDAISTTHLGLALLFLMLTVWLTAATSPRLAARGPLDPETSAVLRVRAPATVALVFLQCLLGGVVRHTDAGLACPDVPTCRGRWLPPLDDGLVTLHFTHRLAAILVALAVASLAWRLLRSGSPAYVRRVALLALAVVVAQVTLGVLSVTTRLGVAPVSLHTLGAAGLLALTTLLWIWGRLDAGRPGAS